MPTPNTGYAIASVAALTAIGAADRAEGYARLLLDDGSGDQTWVVYDDSATSGDYQPDDTPATGYWIKTPKRTATGQSLFTAADKTAARAAIGAPQAPVVGTTRTSITLSTTKADTGLEETITLSNAASRVLVLVAQSYEIPAAANSGLGLYLNRGATEILSPSPEDGTGPFLVYKFFGSSNLNGVLSLQHIDTPGSIGPHTYKTRGRAYNANGAELQPSGATQNGLSTILLWEIP